MTDTHDERQIAKFYQDDITQSYFERLKELIQKKSIYAQQIGLEEVARFLEVIFTEAGATVRVDDSKEAPFVFAKFESPDPSAKTLIFYNHYDTVPADEDQIWTGSPFEVAIRDDKLYGRGVDDDKGHIIARLTAVSKYLADHDSLPVNIIFIMEGAEESASVGLDYYLSKYQSELQGADLLIWEQGRKNAQNQQELSGGNKGIVTFNLSVTSAAVDIHSSFSGVIDGAAWYLIKALNTLRDDQGKIAVEGIYEAVIPPSDRELALIKQYAKDLDYHTLQSLYHLSLDPLVEDQESLVKRAFFEPSLNIEGITTGYQGKGVKTIIPANASAKAEMRLVPGLSPQYVIQQLKKHFKKQGFEHIKIEMTLGEESYRSDMTAPAIQKVIELAKGYYPDGIAILPTTLGTGPMHLVYEKLGVPMVAVGLGNANSRDHAGDENVSIADYYTHIELIEELVRSYE